MPTIAEQLTQLTQDRDDLVDNLTTKGITGLTGDETFTELVPEVLNIPSGGGTTEPEEKNVNFYDYDGTRIYSYTTSEFVNLTEMPENPSHDGLTAQGWNWDLADAKTCANETGLLNIGQNYVTDDGKTRIYIELPEEKLSPTLLLYIQKNSTVIIDWGDGSGTEKVTSGTTINKKHTYPSAGNYVISIDNTGFISFNGNSNDGYGTSLLSNGENTQYSQDFVYRNAIKKIELGNNVKFSDGALASCYCLETITMPQDIISGYSSSLFQYTFKNCYLLKNFVFPKNGYNNTGYRAGSSHFENCYNLKNVEYGKKSSFGESFCKNCISLNKNQVVVGTTSQLQSYAFYNCATIKKIILSSNVNDISGYSFALCSNLNKILCCGNITNISFMTFQNNKSLGILDLRNNTSVPTLGQNVFNGINCKIIVPDDLYEDWIVATDWSTYASQIVKASEA